MESEKFHKIADALSAKNKKVEEGKMFGKECIKVNGKAFAAFPQKKWFLN